jgi:putative transposase
MRHHLVFILCEGAGREPGPTAATVTRRRVPDVTRRRVPDIGSQSVKATESGGPRGYDAAKKVHGRKPAVPPSETADHIAVDT